MVTDSVPLKLEHSLQVGIPKILLRKEVKTLGKYTVNETRLKKSIVK